MKRLTVVLLSVVFAVALVSSAFGQSTAPSIPEGKCLVYLYCTPDFMNPASLWLFTKDGITTFVTLGYYSFYFADPGSTKFWPVTGAPISGKHLAPLTLDLVAGQTYYLRANFRSDTTLAVVPGESAKSDIATCKQLPN